MIINQILEARNSLVKLTKAKFSEFKTTYAIYKLAKQAENVYDMVNKEQEKIIDIYVQKDDSGQIIVKDNQYQFSSVEKRDKFVQEINKLRAENITDIEPIELTDNDIQFITDFAVEDMIKLDGLIIWK